MTQFLNLKTVPTLSPDILFSKKHVLNQWRRMRPGGNDCDTVFDFLKRSLLLSPDILFSKKHVLNQWRRTNMRPGETIVTQFLNLKTVLLLSPDILFSKKHVLNQWRRTNMRPGGNDCDTVFKFENGPYFWAPIFCFLKACAKSVKTNKHETWRKRLWHSV